MIKFAHIRYQTTPEEISPRGGITVAYEQVGDNIHYAIARCHKNDNFVKAQGRVKAAGRMQSDIHRQSTTLTKQQFMEWLYNTPLNNIGNYPPM